MEEFAELENIGSKNIEDFLAFLRECEQQFYMAQAEEIEQNDITQDILHSLELQEHSYHELASLSKELAQSRKKRREAKDILSTTSPVLNWMENNRKIIKDLENLLGSARKAERSTENRIYTPRSKTKNGK